MVRHGHTPSQRCGTGVAHEMVASAGGQKAIIKMKSHSTFTTAALLASLTIPAVAFAQTPTNSDVEPAAQPIAAPHEQTPAQTEPSPELSSSSSVAVGSTAMPQGEESHSDIVGHRWPNRPMLVTGSIVLVGTYGASAIVGAASDRKADDKLFLPVVGPWLDLKNRDCGVNACGNDTFNKALLISDGALQGLGALAVLLSLVIPESTRTPWYLVGDQKLSITPQVGSGTTGLTAVGQF